LRISSGSRARLMARITSRSAGERVSFR
jgi:hypothetical protein